jgi:energy-coupling factor transporter ATP-binding protein EcfA2
VKNTISQIRNNRPTPTKDALAIRRIRVERLFGRYSYDLKVDASATDATKLLILYGDNGSGKTTLLQLIFNLLSHIDKQGHKSVLAKTKFKSLIVDLGHDAQVVAKRRGKRILGTYTAYVKQRGKVTGRIEFRADRANDIMRPDWQTQDVYDRNVGRFLKGLENLRVALFFVTDDRQLLQNARRARESDDENEESEEGVALRRRLRRSARLRGKYLDRAVSQAISVAVQWAREQVLSGSKQGEADANTIYTGIVRRLANVSAVKRADKRANFGLLITALREQAARTAQFAKFGFPSALNIGELIDSLIRAKRDLPTIYKIVEPFVDTIRAKLDALQEVQDSVSGFVETLNSFFKDKKVDFDLKEGVSIKTSDGTVLPPAALSSGEKQLLLLFCNTLITKNDQAIYLIDEPEISLNIKWQRRLIQRLLISAEKRKVQFILATHSFELFAPFRKNVLQLVDKHDARTKPATSKNY